jgi:hypothetical protein
MNFRRVGPNQSIERVQIKVSKSSVLSLFVPYRHAALYDPRYFSAGILQNLRGIPLHRILLRPNPRETRRRPSFLRGLQNH